jgi:hypothetical protein
VAKDKEIDTGLQRLVAALQGVTAADLAELDQQIASKREQIEGATAALKKELDSLLDCRKLLARRLGIEGPRKARKPKPPKPEARPDPNGAQTPEAAADAALGSLRRQRQVRIAKLLGVGGPLPSSVLANRLEIPQGSMGALLDTTFFEPTASGYRLTAAGRKELLEG